MSTAVSAVRAGTARPSTTDLSNKQDDDAKRKSNSKKHKGDSSHHKHSANHDIDVSMDDWKADTRLDFVDDAFNTETDDTDPCAATDADIESDEEEEQSRPRYVVCGQLCDVYCQPFSVFTCTPHLYHVSHRSKKAQFEKPTSYTVKEQAAPKFLQDHLVKTLTRLRECTERWYRQEL
jgi:uncharacterized DUF497 family protein